MSQTGWKDGDKWVAYEVTLVVLEQLVDGQSIVPARVAIKHVFFRGLLNTQKWPFRHLSLASTSTPVESTHKVRLAIGVLEHRFDERACELGMLLVPGKSVDFARSSCSRR